jgi:hypothetical protein
VQDLTQHLIAQQAQIEVVTLHPIGWRWIYAKSLFKAAVCVTVDSWDATCFGLQCSCSEQWQNFTLHKPISPLVIHVLSFKNSALCWILCSGLERFDSIDSQSEANLFYSWVTSHFIAWEKPAHLAWTDVAPPSCCINLRQKKLILFNNLSNKFQMSASKFPEQWG